MLWAAIDVVWLCAMEAATVSCCFCYFADAKLLVLPILCKFCDNFNLLCNNLIFIEM